MSTNLGTTEEIYFSGFDERIFGNKRHVLTEKVSPKYVEKIRKKLHNLLMKQIMKASSKIQESNLNGKANFMIASPEFLKIINNIQE